MTPKELAEKIWNNIPLGGFKIKGFVAMAELEIQAAYDEGKKDGSNETWEQAAQICEKKTIKYSKRYDFHGDHFDVGAIEISESVVKELRSQVKK